jgi:hypothetical protein
MTKYVYRPAHPDCDENGMVDASIAGPRFLSGPAPNVISDSMSETRHMADGKHYTSKSQFRQATKAAGCVEVGNETKTLLQPRKPIQMSREQRRNDIRQALYQLRGR